MESIFLSSDLSPLQEQVKTTGTDSYRDTDFCKQIIAAFKQVETKHKKRFTVNALNARLTEEYLLPMMVCHDLASGDVIQQVFSFNDYFANKEQITLECKQLVCA